MNYSSNLTPEIIESINILDSFNNFAKKLPKIYFASLKYNFNHSTVLKIADHPYLFMRVHCSKSEKFLSLDEALPRADISPEKVLVNFVDISMYALFTPADYLEFIIKYKDELQENNLESPPQNVQIYQIVLSGSRQKLVFELHNTEYFTQICRIAENLFKTTVSIEDNQITVNTTAENAADANEKYKNLIQAVREKCDRKIHQSMRQKLTSESGNYSYTECIINDTLKCFINDSNKLAEILKNLPPNSTVIIAGGNVTMNSNNTTSNINSTIITKKSTADKKLAFDWIRANPPLRNEIKKDYHSRFVQSTGSPLRIKQFGSQVISHGYTEKNGTDGHSWVAPSRSVIDPDQS